MLRAIEQGLGAVLLLLMYARMGSGIFSGGVARLTWSGFRSPSRLAREPGAVLTFCGPAILVLLVLVWASGLTLGTALIIQPELGSGVRASQGETSSDFLTALCAGGSSLAIVGASDFAPRSSGMRMLYLFNSLLGISIVSLTLTYLMQVYTALQRRNVLALRLHLLTGETGDAAELIGALGPEGRFEGGYPTPAALAAELVFAKESHHFYPVLIYFRFRDPHYSVSRLTLLTLDAVALIKSALDDERYATLKASGSVAQLWRAAMILVTTLERAFLGRRVERAAPPARGGNTDHPGRGGRR